ncbi:MAG: hypothetical protein HY052_05795, partial [Proteobacteria bacterium]|nr:hypothetical protein [Pseudomonadota bacterium]
MFRIIKNYALAEDGVIAPMVAMMFLTLMGFVALGVDVGEGIMQKHALQTATDAAALAAAHELANGLSNASAENAALQEAKNNGYNPAAASAKLDVVIKASDPDDEGRTTAQVTVHQASTSWFSTLLSNQTPVTATTATAEVEADEGVFCMLSTDPTADPAITTSGHVTIDAQGCGMAVNSDSDRSLYLNGNVFVNVGDVH